MMKKYLMLPALLLLTACGGQTDKPAAQSVSDGIFKFNKTSQTVNPEYTLFGLRHLVMNNRTFAKKYAHKYPEQWKTGEAHFSRAENAFQNKETAVSDEYFRLAMEQYNFILQQEQNKV